MNKTKYVLAGILLLAVFSVFMIPLGAKENQLGFDLIKECNPNQYQICGVIAVLLAFGGPLLVMLFPFVFLGNIFSIALLTKMLTRKEISVTLMVLVTLFVTLCIAISFHYLVPAFRFTNAFNM